MGKKGGKGRSENGGLIGSWTCGLRRVAAGRAHVAALDSGEMMEFKRTLATQNN